MAIAQRALQRTAPHVVAALEAIDRTHPHIRPRLIPDQGTAAAPVLVVAGRVGRDQVRL